MINLLLKNIFTFHRQLDAGREILNHGFADGNKRVALHAMELLLLLNGIKLTCSQEARVNIMMSVASGKCSAAQLKIGCFQIRNVSRPLS